MKVVFYDSNPGEGLDQFLLKLCWMVGCWYQKAIGAIDEYFGVSSFDELIHKMEGLRSPVAQIQYWGHGGPGTPVISRKGTTAAQWIQLGRFFAKRESSYLWFRCCSVFRSVPGHDFSGWVADGLGVKVAGHTRVIGPVQGGLHTRSPNTLPTWPLSEGELNGPIPGHLRWGPNSVLFTATDIPEGW